jgi:hypothetical protein
MSYLVPPPPVPPIVHIAQTIGVERSTTAPPKPIPLEAVRHTPVFKQADVLLQPPSNSLSQIPQPTTPFPPGSPPQPAPTQPSPSPAPIPSEQLTTEGILELRADQQVYDQQRQIFTAEGNVTLRFRGALLTAQRLQVNLVNRLTVAEGDVALTRGSQVLRGQRFRYNLVQEEGTIEQASGEIFLRSASGDFNPNLPTDITAGSVPAGSVGDRISANQPPQGVTQAGRLGITLGSRNTLGGVAAIPEDGGTINRLRFQAAQIAFYPTGWIARDIRITNDPFSPAELELRTSQAELRRISPRRDEVFASDARLVFDQGFALPLLRRRVVLNRDRRPVNLFNIGIDGVERGGIFVERDFPLIPDGPVELTITPQFYAQRVVQGSRNVGDWFGVRTRLTAPLGPRTVVRGDVSLTSLDLGNFENNLRGSVRGLQAIGTHTLSLEASYRDRLFNNSLGFQDVRSSVGLLFFSPPIAIGNTGIGLSYQAGYQFVTADTDRADLLNLVRTNNRISLGRFQASAALSKGFTLWQGQPLPATKDQGLRYSPKPLVPYLALGVGLTGTTSSYTNGDSQNNLNASVSLYGQLGRFSRDFLDYTAFNVTYTQAIRTGLSPFLFDRVADDRILSAGILQQIYGPFRFGIQTSYNVQTGREISTDYVLEYNRRTYSVALRYNPTLQLGSVSLQISDFNWTSGGSEPFEGSGVRPVQGGVQRLP